ncbi:polysaccharide lyase family 8 super-sandwich domain-containing protein [Paenibacillus qinlingensis]|nr:polysaccharide lyase family 8 super-sandwich domain-containing protein [Paenibacillus qinlingensis]
MRRKRLRKTGIWAMVLLMCFMLVPNNSMAAESDEFDVLRLRLFDMITGGSTFDPDDVDIRPKIEIITSNAQNAWSTMAKQTDRTYLWSDLSSSKDTVDDPNTAEIEKPVSAHVSGSFQRLESMAIAYSTKGSTLQGNADLLADIQSGLQWMYVNRYNESFPTRTQRYDNWFDWEIASPTSLDNIGVLLYDALSPEVLAIILKQVKFMLPDLNNPASTGANQLSFCNITMIHGVISKNSTVLFAARNGVSRVLADVKTDDGFYSDGSFIQHHTYAYNGGYGTSMLDNLSRMIYILSQSTWEIVDPNLAIFYKHVSDGFEPFVYDGEMMDMVRGRYISRGNGHAGHSVIGSLVRLALLAPAEEAATYKSMVKYWVEQDTYDDIYPTLSSISLIIELKKLMQDNTVKPRGELIAHKQYPSMDRTVHLGNGYGFGISMFSSRIANYESINGENLKGWHTGDGMTYLYNADASQYDDDFWPTVNSYRLPGTTVNVNSENASGQLSPYNWVGGTEISGLYGVSGMQFRSPGATLQAKKSWFMFDDEIVALGAGISSNDNKDVETIIENRKLNNNGDNVLTVNGQLHPENLGETEMLPNVSWAHLQGKVPGSDVGYYFPVAGSVKALRESRTDQWISTNVGGSESNSTRSYMNLWFDHGTNPNNETYSYVLLPGKSSEEVGNYSTHPDIEVIENSSQAQAVKETKLGITGINFWNDGLTTVNQVTSNKKASVMIKQTEEDMEISVSDPTMANTGTIDLVLDTDFGDIVSIDPGVSLNHSDDKAKISVNVKDARGMTFHVKFRLPGKKQALAAPTGLIATQNGANGVQLSWQAVDKADALLAAPANLTISGNTVNSLTVNWEAVEGAADYRLYRSTSVDGDYYSILNLQPGATTYTDTKLGSGTQYFYKVMAVNTKGISAYSEINSAWTVPVAPTGLHVVTNMGTTLSLAWNEVPGTTEYKLYRSTSLTGNFELVTSLGTMITSTSYTDSGLEEGMNYYYKITSVNLGGESAATAPLSTIFNVPANVIDDNFDDFNRGELNGQRNWVTTIPTGTEATVEEETPNSAYVYIKKNSNYQGDPSISHTLSIPAGAIVTAEVTVKADDIQYKTVLDLRDSATNKRAVNIIMQSNKIWGYSGSSKVDLLNPMDLNKSYKLKAIVNMATKKFDMYVDDQLVGNQWSFRESPVNKIDTVIFALGGTASSMKLDQVKISFVPLIPTNVTASEQTGSGLKLSWTPVTGATGYRIYRSLSANTGFKLAAEVPSGSSYTDSGLVAKTTYYYKMVALSGSAISAESSLLTTTTKNASGLSIPTTPDALFASDNTGTSIKLSWKASKDAASYSVYRSTASGDQFELAGTTNSPFFLDTGLDGITSYSYKVVAVNEEGDSPDSNIVSSSFNVVQTLISDNFDSDALGADPAGWTIVEDTGRPVTVVNATYAAAPGHAVRLTGGNALETSAVRTFGDAQGVQGIVTVETDVLPTNANWKNIPVIINPAGAAAVHAYFSASQIFAYKSSSSSSKTAIFSPVVFDGTWYRTKIVLNTSTNKFDLFVNDSSAASASQFGFRTVSSSVYGVKVAVDNVSSLDFDNVKAYFKPLAPTSLTASANTASSIKLTWGAATGAASYKLYRSLSPEQGYKQVYAGTELTFTDNGLTSGTTYYYKVAAVKAGAASDASNRVTASTTSTPVAVMEYDNSKSLKNEVRILSARTDADPGQVGYIIYRDGVDVGRTFTTAFVESELEAGKTYQYAIVAYDNLGHLSTASEAVAYTVPTNTTTLPDDIDDDSPGNSPGPGTTTGTSPSDSILQKPILDTKTGEAKVTVEPSAILTKLEQLKADTTGINRISIDVPKVKGATAYSIVLPTAALTEDKSTQKLELRTDAANVVVPTNMFANINADNVKEIGVTIGFADPGTLPDAVKAQTGNRPVIELHATADGKPIAFNNPDAAVEVSIPYTPTAEELKHPEHLVIWYIDGAGKVVAVPNSRYNAVTGTISFTTTHFSIYAVAYVFKNFDDLGRYDWAKDAIEVMAAKGIINGTSEKSFEPAANITRADFLLLLVKSLGLTANTDVNFEDVNKASYYYEAVAIAKKLGITQGSGANQFSPNTAISRQDMMVIAARAMRTAKKLNTNTVGTSVDLNVFTDKSDVSAYAIEDLAAMSKEGIIQGNGSLLNPLGHATRAEAALIIYRIYNK